MAKAWQIVADIPSISIRAELPFYQEGLPTARSLSSKEDDRNRREDRD
jgi:hypothetical protein